MLVWDNILLSKNTDDSELYEPVLNTVFSHRELWWSWQDSAEILIHVAGAFIVLFVRNRT